MSGAAWPAALARGWHPVAYVREIGAKPIAVTLMDRPLVLFRSGDGVGVLEDRCPHRNVPLSRGRCRNGEIECPYHGWRFDASGACRHVPGAEAPAFARAAGFPVRLDHGLVWTTLAGEPAAFPVLPAQIGDPAYDSFWWRLQSSRAAIGDAIENLLDPIHAYFLHPGLVRRARGPGAVDIDFAVEPSGAVARYTEPREHMTLLQRLTEGSRSVSCGRYRAPSLVQITFEDERGVNASISVVFMPVGAHETRPFACFSTRRGIAPAWLKRAFIVAFHRVVLAQDRRMLRLQADNSERFGGPNYHHGPLDMFGPVIWAGLNGRPLEPMRKRLKLATGSSGRLPAADDAAQLAREVGDDATLDSDVRL